MIRKNNSTLRLTRRYRFIFRDKERRKGGVVLRIRLYRNFSSLSILDYS